MICAEELVVYLGIIILITIGVLLATYIYKHPKEAIKLLLIAAVAILFVIGVAGAEDFKNAIGEVITEENIDGVLYAIKEVEPGLWIIPVKTEYGIISFYSDVSEWEGSVYLLLFGEDYEVIDAFMIDDLECPFTMGSSLLADSFFYFLRTL